MEMREGKYLSKLAETPDEKEQIYKLRHSIYYKELNFVGEKKDCDKDYDYYDQICDHLIIRDEEKNRCVGTFRFLQGQMLEDVGFYSEQWFDIGELNRQRTKVLEIGRACIDMQYRNTKVFKMLFSGVGAYLKLYPHDYLIGLTTLTLASEKDIRMITQYLLEKKAINFSFGIKPKKHYIINEAEKGELNMEAISEKEIIKKISTLMWGYYKYGAEFISEPSIDGDFNPPVVDFFTIFDTKRFPDW
jgi:L-ornithine Nalpha-acyltransferase